MLYGISDSATNDVWAVGTAVARGFGASNVVVDHWTGSSWTAVSAPNPGSQWNELNGVVAVTPTDVWAVGYLKGSDDQEQPLIEHWDGTAWSVSPAPVPSPGGNRLQGVGGSSPTDVWAVGVTGSPTSLKPLIEHWNGAAWSIVPAPANTSTDEVLSSVTSLAANDAWAVGDIDTGTHDQPLALHWDGTSWTATSLSTKDDARLYGVAPDGTGGAWAVGAAVTAIDEATPRQAPLFVDLTASSPTVVLSSTTNGAGLEAVASSPGRLFAVGYREAGTAAGDPDPEKANQTLIKQL
jgi:hypothetical protein